MWRQNRNGTGEPWIGMRVRVCAMMGRVSESGDEMVTGTAGWWLGLLDSGDSLFAY